MESLDLQTEIGNRQGMVECLVAFAGLALQSAPAEHAVELLFAAEALLADLDAPLAPVDALDFEQDRARGKAILNERARAEAERRGRALSLTEALALARSHLASRPRTAGPTPPSNAPGGLSPRELEVVTLIAKGRSNREIATALTITEKTAANHVEHIMTKLDLRSRAQMAVWAIQQHSMASD